MTRIDVINNLIKNNGYTKYLEIGVQHGESFNAVKCKYKVGVDPDLESKATHKMTSDEFFKQNTEKFDIVFIDGLHHSGQCTKDIRNSMSCLHAGGVIVVHDLLPTSKEMQEVPRKTRQWTGDVWRAWLFFRGARLMEVYDFDYGVGVISDTDDEDLELNHKMTFEQWQANRDKLMNVVKYENRRII